MFNVQEEEAACRHVYLHVLPYAYESMTIFSLAAVFAALGLAGATSSIPSALILVLGVFLGSALWWLLFAGAFSVFKSRFDHHEIQLINRIAGLVITSFGVFALAGLL